MSRKSKWAMIGSWINCILLSIEILVSCFYWARYNRSINTPTKILICGMLCNDITQSIIVCAGAYMVHISVV